MMHPATPELRADWRRPSGRQRALVIGLTLVAELLFLLVLFGLGPASWSGRKQSQPTLVELIPSPQAAVAPEPAKSAEAKAKPPPKVPQPTTPRLPPTPLAKSPFVKLTREEYAAADISKLGSAGGQGKSQGANSAAVGTGPGGATLYKAEWYRRPSNAELNGYMTKSPEPGSWAEVACKTIADNRVENCQALDEFPRGSGLGRAVRLAGWQFRIRPPRIDGKPMVGTWVLVHIDFTGGPE
ncbi:MAG: hypothetical protein LH610_10225 [Sphingomonas bacterium]|nr:hypothetical protein [Sphingomonas bacterium]